MALMPMPEARATGRLAMRPMATVITAAPTQVAVRPASNGTPASERMAGLTATM